MSSPLSEAPLLQSVLLCQLIVAAVASMGAKKEILARRLFNLQLSQKYSFSTWSNNSLRRINQSGAVRKMAAFDAWRAVLHLLLLVLGGFFSQRVDALTCNPGAYFDGVKCSLCPGGTYGERPGLASPQCSGACAGGYFCPEGSTSPMQNICGRSIYYCPPGSAMRKLVTAGYYTVMYPIDANQKGTTNAAATQKMCETGHFCESGIRYACVEGSYGERFGLTASDCSGQCPKGFYCPSATSHPIPCPPGTFGSERGLQDARCSGACPLGFYW